MDTGKITPGKDVGDRKELGGADEEISTAWEVQFDSSLFHHVHFAPTHTKQPFREQGSPHETKHWLFTFKGLLDWVKILRNGM